MSKVDIKIVLLGKHSVGKTCLVERYLYGRFQQNTIATVGAAFGAKKVNVNGKEITLGIWDTAGQERYESMSRIYYRSAKAAIICYDVTDLKSFDKVKFWIEELLTNEEQCNIYIVGTKLDEIEDKNKLDTSIQKGYANEIGAKFFLTSSKTGEGIEELFQEIAQSSIKSENNNNNNNQNNNHNNINNNNTNNNNKNINIINQNNNINEFTNSSEKKRQCCY